MGTPKKHDAKKVHEAIESVVSGIIRHHRGNGHLLLLGIANGGIVLTERVAQRLRKSGLACGTGTIDISFHRDDIGQRPIPKEFVPTLIPHDVNGATVILVDDVLYSGRTVKAALDELFDHGRPTKVELAVLVDRSGRRLPIAADYTGLVLAATDAEKVTVHLDALDPSADAIRVIAAPASRQSAL
ncbi:MAG: bifunctional pyr operon transcriptional regulator/uracil phosphoribosyltransferase PyrR [Opitutae bacterium]|nr:bifunctional pyr operon transcriptional regulator/uracil phosphoribosyltransferase PyrR [Opitutae bacterium]